MHYASTRERNADLTNGWAEADRLNNLIQDHPNATDTQKRLAQEHRDNTHHYRSPSVVWDIVQGLYLIHEQIAAPDEPATVHNTIDAAVEALGYAGLAAAVESTDVAIETLTEAQTHITAALAQLTTKRAKK